MRSYHDIVGDGGSDVLGQVAAQRARIEQALAEVRWIVAVGSGKGGVGKSTLTMQLARCFQRTGRPTAILDADFNGPTQARLAGLRSATLLPGSRGMALPRTADGLGVVSLGSVVPESEAVDFESVASGESHTWRATREFALLGELLGSVEWGALDLLLLDLPPGAERTQQYAEFLGPKAAFVLVTIPTDLARGVVARSVAAVRKTENPLLGYIENMRGYYCEDCATIRPLFPETREVELDLPCLGQVPFDPQLAAACDQGESLLGDAGRASADALHALAQRLRGLLEELEETR